MTSTTLRTLRPATAPIDSTGRERHDVSLLVVDRPAVIDTRFRNLAAHLNGGDVLVVNTSSTEPAALSGWRSDEPVTVHVSGPGQTGGWVVELRHPDRSGPVLDARPGDRITIHDTPPLTLRGPVKATAGGVRLWHAERSGGRSLVRDIRRHGRPIRYEYVPEAWPLAMYRSAFERQRSEFSSAEMPSAARPFTATVLADLARKGVGIAEITLHTGVSSPEVHEGPMPERFEVPSETAALITHTRRRGKRVIAVGTTAARALESAVMGRDTVVAAHGWTDLVLSGQRPTKVTDGIITGWHPPEASHLQLLQSVAGEETVRLAYERAEELGYRSHEFGDSCLLMRQSPARSGRRTRVRASR